MTEVLWVWCLNDRDVITATGINTRWCQTDDHDEWQRHPPDAPEEVNWNGRHSRSPTSHFSTLLTGRVVRNSKVTYGKLPGLAAHGIGDACTPSDESGLAHFHLIRLFPHPRLGIS